MRPLSRHTPGGLVVARMDFPAERTIPDPRSHEGHEWLYVLSGRLRLVLGDDDLDPRAGRGRRVLDLDAALDGRRRRPAQALAIFGPQGQRVHLRT